MLSVTIKSIIQSVIVLSVIMLVVMLDVKEWAYPNTLAYCLFQLNRAKKFYNIGSKLPEGQGGKAAKDEAFEKTQKNPGTQSQKGNRKKSESSIS